MKRTTNLILATALLASATATAQDLPTKHPEQAPPLWFQQACSNRLENFSASVHQVPALLAIEHRGSVREYLTSAEMQSLVAANRYDLLSDINATQTISTGDDRFHCGRGIVYISITPAKQVFAIPSEFEEGSCVYNQLKANIVASLSHEEKYLTDIIPEIDSAVRISLGNNIIYGRSASDISTQLHEHYYDRIRPYIYNRLNDVALLAPAPGAQLLDDALMRCSNQVN